MKKLLALTCFILVFLIGMTNANPTDMVWVDIDDPGVSGHEGFIGQMSKYETTNAQYCQFLNDALDSGDITVSDNAIYGANGSNNGADFVGEVYYDLAGMGLTVNGATNGGATRINFSGGLFSVDSGFENHPVTWVSWYGATAFCNYYGYRLPTEWEWQAVADYDGSYIYGCGTTISNSIANYYNSNHPDGTSIVGAFGTYGYGVCDMAGNVWEWTSSCYYSNCSGGYRVPRGGSWSTYEEYCTVSTRGSYWPPNEMQWILGFRVCHSEVAVSIDIKPGSCPNPLNVNSNGVIPVSVLGTEDFDVYNISWAVLEGIPPLKISYEDVATPVGVYADECLCTKRGPDGYMDLVMHFNTQEIISGLCAPSDGQVISLAVVGELIDGTAIKGEDFVVIRNKKN